MKISKAILIGSIVTFIAALAAALLMMQIAKSDEITGGDLLIVAGLYGSPFVGLMAALWDKYWE